jgi:prepilin-type N-terminal cleavage/methylation domain-containing protein
MRLTTSRRRGVQRGLSLVELMVGITVGLIVTAAASMVAVNQITEHRRLMLETQLQQDLRTAADLVQLDIRRAGFRGNTGYGVWTPATLVGSSLEKGANASADNAYSEIKVSADNHRLTYTYSQVVTGTPGDKPADNEHFGVEWRPSTKTLYLLVGVKDGDENWQPITDPDILEITHFRVEEKKQILDLIDFCDSTGPGGTASGPQQEVRRINLTLEGKAKHDPRVVRNLTVTERLRADHITGSCPA